MFEVLKEMGQDVVNAVTLSQSFTGKFKGTEGTLDRVNGATSVIKNANASHRALIDGGVAGSFRPGSIFDNNDPVVNIDQLDNSKFVEPAATPA